MIVSFLFLEGDHFGPIHWHIRGYKATKMLIKTQERPKLRTFFQLHILPFGTWRGRLNTGSLSSCTSGNVHGTIRWMMRGLVNAFAMCGGEAAATH